MPRNVRNFWLELEVDGQKAKVGTGPIAKDGGFALSIKIRDKGTVAHIGCLEGRVYSEESLALRWLPTEGKTLTLASSKR